MWLDTALHQAMGLHSFTPEQQLRLLPVVSQPGPETAGLELLWQLCSVLQRLSYPVIVLDGGSAEGKQAPGLAHLLGGMPWPGGAASDTSPALAILPAARGLAELARLEQARAGAGLAPLARLFRSYTVAVLHASAEQLAPLLRSRSDCIPLVVTGPRARGMVGSYRQLKHLALHAGTAHCTLAALRTTGGSRDAERQTAEALATLQRSARQHLGLNAHTTMVAPGHLQDVQRLALQLLENGCTMNTASERPAAPLPFGLDASHPPHLDRSH